jgi:hypothetical protein
MSLEPEYAKEVTQRSRTALVVGGFTVLAVMPFLIAATKETFWQRQHSMASFVTVLYLLVVAALVWRRSRWAWYVLAVFIGVVVVGWVFDSNRFQGSHVVGFVLALGAFALLLSSEMRHRLRRPVWTPRVGRTEPQA